LGAIKKKTMKHFKQSILTIAIFVTICSCSTDKQGHETENPLTVDNIETTRFSIYADQDTTLVCPKGTVLRIYENTFVDASGNKATGQVNIEVKEVLTNEDIVLANLHTVSNGQILESGGMVYINATADPYSIHYQMYDYVTKELPSLLENEMAIGKDGLKAICGHSMGGHGALTIALREGKDSWRSVSAFAPICHPTACPWGKKAFEGYLGSVEAGKVHDATCLMESLQSEQCYEEILIDQGTADEFLEKGQLLPEDLVAAAEKSGQKLVLNMRKGFDHSYYFIAKFIEDHVHFHAKYLA
jgi:S-formylglutathione hydrolase FrmB